MPPLTIEQIGELARAHRPTPGELMERQVSIAAGLLSHKSAYSYDEATEAIKKATGSLLVSQAELESA